MTPEQTKCGAVTSRADVAACVDLFKKNRDSIGGIVVDSGVKLQSAGAPDALVMADPDAMHQVFGNLMENALKYAQSGKRIRAGARLLAAFGIYIGRFEVRNSWDIVLRPGLLVRDTWHQLTSPALYPRTLGVTFSYAVFLMLTYATLCEIAGLLPTLRRFRRFTRARGEGSTR